MTRLARFVNTTAFKLSAIYIAVFSVFAIVFIVYISQSTNQLLAEQLSDTIDAELRGLGEQWRAGGLAALVATIQLRSQRPGASLYLVTDPAGRVVAGNVTEVPPDVLQRAGEPPFAVPYERGEGGTAYTAMVRVVQLSQGFRLLVGRDLAERERFREITGRALVLAAVLMIGLALVSWFFVSRRVLKRIDSVTATSEQIMAGDLGGRLEVTGSDDEFDRLAAALNAMLDRIEMLLYGLKDVSDNIAHDLKTPLTRMRNRLEATLAGPRDGETDQAALEATIEEADDLIRTFNALLMIARIEAGSPDGTMGEVDAAAVLRDVGDLYEPVADEAGIALAVDLPDALPVSSNRELLSQALANLIDNAIKHARPQDPDACPRVDIVAKTEDDAVLITVSDNGPGIAPEDRDRVMQRFVRLEKSRTTPGSGLGLSLVAAVVRLHRGTIELSDAGPGLSVTIRLPRRAE